MYIYNTKYRKFSLKMITEFQLKVTRFTPLLAVNGRQKEARLSTCQCVKHCYSRQKHYNKGNPDYRV